MTFSDAQMLGWLGAYWLPFMRIGGALLVVPLFGNRHIPARVRILLAVLCAVLVAPQLPPPPLVSPLSVPAVLLAANELLIGLFLGFLIQLVFEAVMMAGQLISNGMGLSFSIMNDPQQGIAVPVVGQFLMLISLLLFLAMNGHLEFLRLVAGSFRIWPAGQAWLDGATLLGVAGGLSELFRGAVRVALPAVMALLVVQVAMGVISRSAPTLNLFAVGFPLAILLGFVVMERILPGLLPILDHLLTTAMGRAAELLQGGARG